MRTKLAYLSVLLLLSGCSGDQMAAWIPQGDASSGGTSARLKACALDQARIKVQDGSAFAQGISAAADEISTTCVKKLALQSAGVDEQASSDAYGALQTLMSTASSFK